MIIVKKDTTPIADECILLGRQCENEARQIEFDLSWLIDEYGSGTAVLVHQRNKDVAPYICTTTQSDNILTWTLDNQDTVYDGWGQAELRWSVGDVLAKTLIYKTMVIRSITADTTIPEPLESWYDEMIDYIDEHGIDPEDLAAAIAAYLDEHPVEAPVQSVNNKTGAVVLTASDVGALPDSTTIPTKVSQLQNDSGFGTYSKPSGGIPKTDLASAVQTSLGKADSALQTAPVTSVNNKTGAVTLTASDVGAGTYSKPSGGIPSTDMSSAVQTSLGKADTALQSAPVSSVNSKTGAVTLAAGDIGYDGSTTYSSGSVGKAISTLNGDYTDLDNRVTALEQGGSGGGLTADIKQALLQLAAKVAYVDDDGQDYYDDLYDALYPHAPLVSISAVYTQTEIITTSDSLDDLKSDLVVTATYDDTTTETVTDYTLSGTLTAGTSTITVSYGGKTDTFDVTVTQDTTAEIEYENYTLDWKQAQGGYYRKSLTNAGITKKYQLTSATTSLYVAGIIPYADSVFTANNNILVAYDGNGNEVNYVAEKTTSADNRWAQKSATPSEYKNEWTIDQYSQIAFSVDIRYLDKAYMYHYPTGQVLFAGKNTPYFGMSNISEAE